MLASVVHVSEAGVLVVSQAPASLEAVHARVVELPSRPQPVSLAGPPLWVEDDPSLSVCAVKCRAREMGGSLLEPAQSLDCQREPSLKHMRGKTI